MGKSRQKMMLHLILKKTIISLSAMLIEPTNMEVEHPKKCRLQQPSYNLNLEDGEFTVKKKTSLNTEFNQRCMVILPPQMDFTTVVKRRKSRINLCINSSNMPP